MNIVCQQFCLKLKLEDWGAILGDKVMVSAIIDREVHPAHIRRFPAKVTGSKISWHNSTILTSFELPCGALLVISDSM